MSCSKIATALSLISSGVSILVSNFPALASTDEILPPQLSTSESLNLDSKAVQMAIKSEAASPEAIQPSMSQIEWSTKENSSFVPTDAQEVSSASLVSSPVEPFSEELTSVQTNSIGIQTLSPPPIQEEAISVSSNSESTLVETPIAVEGQELLERLSPNSDPLFVPTQPEAVQVQSTEQISLAQALELAQRNNRQLQIVQQQLVKTRAGLQQAKAARLPNLQAGFGLNQGLASSSVLISRFLDSSEGSTSYTSSSRDVNGNLTLSYDVYTGGRRSTNIRQAEEQVKFALLEIERITRQIEIDTANEYYNLQAATEEVRIAALTVENAKLIYQDAVEARNTKNQDDQLGASRANADVQRAEVQLENARQQLSRAQNQQRIARSQLVKVLSIPDGIDIDVNPVDVDAPELTEQLERWDFSLEESVILAFQKRPELKQQMIQQSIAEAQRQIALANLKPRVQLIARVDALDVLKAGGGASTALADQGIGIGYSASVQTQWNLFDGGAARASARQSESDVAVAQIQFADTRNQIRQQIQEAYSNLQTSQSNITIARRAVGLAKETLDLTRQQFLNGVGRQTDVIAAANDLNQARLNLINAVLEYNRAIATLKRAT